CANVYCHGTGTPTWKATFLNSTIADCDKCHALPPTPGSGSHSTIPAAITSIAGLSACSSRAPSTGCHPTINAAPSTYANIFFDKNLHIDGIVQGGTCVGCHSITQPQASPKRIAAASQFNFQSHHVQGATADDTHCAKCHWEANSDGSINSTYHDKVSGKPVDLVIWTGTSRPAGTTYTEGSTGTAYTANGTRAEISKINSHCLGCHNVTNAETPTFTADSNTPTKYSPEPRMVPALAKTSILSRYSSTTTVPWSNYAFTNSSGQVMQYGTNQKKQITKALSAHGNAIKNQFPAWSATRGEDETMTDAATATAKTDTRRNVFCYDCHNSHGSEATGITSSYSSATGRYKGGLLKTTKNGQGGYTVDYTPAARTINYKNYSTTAASATTTALFNTGASICNDCHNNDTR